jgi:hypothetical protein
MIGGVFYRAAYRLWRASGGCGGSVVSPRVPVAIRNDAVSRIAAANAAVTRATGVLIVTRSRC